MGLALHHINPQCILLDTDVHNAALWDFNIALWERNKQEGIHDQP